MKGLGLGTHSTEIPEVGHFPSEAPLVANGHPIVPHRSIPSVNGLTRIYRKQMGRRNSIDRTN